MKGYFIVFVLFLAIACTKNEIQSSMLLGESKEINHENLKNDNIEDNINNRLDIENLYSNNNFTTIPDETEDKKIKWMNIISPFKPYKLFLSLVFILGLSGSIIEYHPNYLYSYANYPYSKIKNLFITDSDLIFLPNTDINYNPIEEISTPKEEKENNIIYSNRRRLRDNCTDDYYLAFSVGTIWGIALTFCSGFCCYHSYRYCHENCTNRRCLNPCCFSVCSNKIPNLKNIILKIKQKQNTQANKKNKQSLVLAHSKNARYINLKDEITIQDEYKEEEEDIVNSNKDSRKNNNKYNDSDEEDLSNKQNSNNILIPNFEELHSQMNPRNSNINSDSNKLRNQNIEDLP